MPGLHPGTTQGTDSEEWLVVVSGQRSWFLFCDTSNLLVLPFTKELGPGADSCIEKKKGYPCPFHGVYSLLLVSRLDAALFAYILFSNAATYDHGLDTLSAINDGGDTNQK